ncbi:MAG: type II toxin-antitoxin system VapC family toxin [Gemmatimonadota bacterium]
MLSIDVNVLIYAHREEFHNHPRFKSWLEATVNAPNPYGLSDLVLSAFLRIVTNPRVFPSPTPLDQAIGFVGDLRGRKNCVVLTPGPRHWEIFLELCLKGGAEGSLVSDAYHAALAIESGCEWVTTDRDYARFPDLRWRHPFD